MSSKLHLRVWMSGVVLLLAACQPAELPHAESQPTPEMLTLSHPPTLRWLAPAFNTCAMEDPPLSVLVVDAGDTPDVTLYWGEPDEVTGEIFLLGEDALVLVTHPSNPANGLTQAEARERFTGKDAAWPDGEPLTVYVLPAGHAVQKAFEATLGRSIPKSVEMRLAPSLEAMRQYVADDPTALGVLPQSWVSEEVKALNWEVEPRQPILASFEGERAEAFVRCVQGAVVEKLGE